MLGWLCPRPGDTASIADCRDVEREDCHRRAEPPPAEHSTSRLVARDWREADGRDVSFAGTRTAVDRPLAPASHRYLPNPA